jgi:hypothetical protein
VRGEGGGEGKGAPEGVLDSCNHDFAFLGCEVA